MTYSEDIDIPTRHLQITQRLRQRRDDLGLTQKQVVTRLGKCGLHTTNRALSSLEHGTGLDVAKLPELAAALDCTVTYLVGLTTDAHSWTPDDSLIVPGRGAPLTIPVRSSEAPAAPRVTASLILGADVPDRPLGRR
jgi:transcriptional regulator with XRE-family HTH domain